MHCAICGKMITGDGYKLGDVNIYICIGCGGYNRSYLPAKIKERIRLSLNDAKFLSKNNRKVHYIANIYMTFQKLPGILFPKFLTFRNRTITCIVCSLLKRFLDLTLGLMA